MPKIFGNYQPAGTISARTKQPLVLTAPGAKKNKVGSEIQCKVESPAGYVLVYADLDAQEQRIFGLLGDAQYGEVGSTPNSYMNLCGDKDAGTDPHTVTAKNAGISRNQAKIVNYSLAFGSGAKKLARTLYAGSKEKSLAEWEKIAKKIIEDKKGKRVWNSSMLTGGYESDNFNAMTVRTQEECQREVMLGRAITTALRRPVVGQDFSQSRNNFNIQSTGASMLHTWLTYIHYLARRYDIGIAFCWSVHDAAYTCVKESDAKAMAYVFMHAHKLMYQHLCKQLGFTALPTALAYPASVMVSKRWLKALDANTETPTYGGDTDGGIEYRSRDLLKVGTMLETRRKLKEKANERK